MGDDSALHASRQLAATPRAFRAGETLPDLTYRVTRADLVRYAGASGDFNPIHWSDRVATAVGLPGVIAHGMYTMALAGRAVTSWAGDPGAVVEYGVRFTKPVIVPDDDAGTEVVVSGDPRGYRLGRRVDPSCGGCDLDWSRRLRVLLPGGLGLSGGPDCCAPPRLSGLRR